MSKILKKVALVITALAFVIGGFALYVKNMTLFKKDE